MFAPAPWSDLIGCLVSIASRRPHIERLAELLRLIAAPKLVSWAPYAARASSRWLPEDGPFEPLFHVDDLDPDLPFAETDLFEAVRSLIRLGWDAQHEPPPSGAEPPREARRGPAWPSPSCWQEIRERLDRLRAEGVAWAAGDCSLTAADLRWALQHHERVVREWGIAQLGLIGEPVAAPSVSPTGRA